MSERPQTHTQYCTHTLLSFAYVAHAHLLTISLLDFLALNSDSPCVRSSINTRQQGISCQVNKRIIEDGQSPN